MKPVQVLPSLFFSDRSFGEWHKPGAFDFQDPNRRLGERFAQQVSLPLYEVLTVNIALMICIVATDQFRKSDERVHNRLAKIVREQAKELRRQQNRIEEEERSLMMAGIQYNSSKHQPVVNQDANNLMNAQQAVEFIQNNSPRPFEAPDIPF